MVLGIFGLPGNGKTTFLAKMAQKCLNGKTYMGIKPHSKVFTNFACPGCYKLDFDKLGLYHYSDCLFLIDEIMLIADSRNYKNFSDNHKRFFALMRHLGSDCCFASQYWSDCDLRIRNLTQRYYLIEKSRILPVSYVKPIVRILGVDKGAIADTYELAPPISWKFVWRPAYYKYFNSFEMEELPPPELELWDTYVPSPRVDAEEGDPA